MIALLWKFGLNFWYLRNGEIYGTTEEELQDYHKQQLRDRIDSAFDDKDLISDATDHDLLFSIDKDELLEDSLDKQINWLPLHDTCVAAPVNPTPDSETPKPEPQLHQFFRPFQKFYNNRKPVSMCGSCQPKRP